MFKVFVYGTLKPGQSNYSSYCAGKVIEEIQAFTYGELYHLPSLGYPAMVEGKRKVEGYLLTFTENYILSKLDDLEDYGEDNSPEENFYQRRLVQIYDLSEQSIGKAWAYFMEREKVEALKGIFLSFDCWYPDKF